MQKLLQDNPMCPHDKKLSDCNTCFELVSVRESYDALMDSMRKRPDVNDYFLNMTHLYHADALKFSSPAYEKLKKPYLVVTGELDSIIESSDLFVEKAKASGVPITYHRIVGMDHYVRKRPDVIKNSFDWLKKCLEESLYEKE